MIGPSEFVIAEMERLWRAGYSWSEIKSRMEREGIRFTLEHRKAFDRFGLGNSR